MYISYPCLFPRPRSTKYGPARNRVTFPTPVAQKRTCGSWSGCGNRLAVSSGGEIRVYRPRSTRRAPAAYKTGSSVINSNARTHDGSSARDGWVAPSADEYTARFPTDTRAGHGKERSGSGTDGSRVDAVVDGNSRSCGVPSSTSVDVNVTSQDGEERPTSSCISGAEFRTVLCVEALMKPGLGGASGSSSPLSSPSPRRSPSPEPAPLCVQQSLAPLHKTELPKAEPTTVGQEQDRLASSLRRKGEAPAAVGLSAGSRRSGGGGGDRSSRCSSRSRSSLSRSRSSLVIGDMRAMCPGGPNAFFGTTDGCLGLGSLLGGLGLSLPAVPDNQSRRCLNDSFFESSNPNNGHGEGGGVAGDAFLKAVVVNDSIKRVESEAATAGERGREISAVSTTGAIIEADSGSSLLLPPPPAPPSTSGRRGGFRNVLPGQNWQAGPLRPRLKGKDSAAAEMPRRTKLQPWSSSALSDAGVIAVAEDAALTLGAAGTIVGGKSSSNGSGSSSSNNSSTVLGASSTSRLSRIPCLLGNTYPTTNVAIAAVSSTPRDSSLPPQRGSSRIHSTESTVHDSSSASLSSEIIDLRGKLGDGSSAVPAVHPLLRLPLGGGVTGSGGGAATTNASCLSLASAGGAAVLGDMDGKGHGAVVSNGAGGGPLGDRKASSRQPCLMLVTASSPDAGRHGPGAWESGHGVAVETVATLPPALSSPDLLAASEDGTLVCVGSHACGLVACYRVAPLTSPGTSTVVSPGSTASSTSSPPPSPTARHASGNSTATSAGRSGAPLDRNSKSEKNSERATPSESSSSRIGGGGGTARAFGLYDGASAEGSTATGNRKSRSRSRNRRVRHARPICTLRLPPALRAKGLAFASVGPQPQEEQRRQQQRHRQAGRNDSAVANLAAGEEGEKPKSAGKSAGGEGLGGGGVAVLVLAAAPVAPSSAALSSSRKSPFGSSIGANRASSSTRASGSGSGSGPSSCCRTVLLRYLLPAAADEQRAVGVPPRDFSSGLSSPKGVNAPPKDNAAGASWALRHAVSERI